MSNAQNTFKLGLKWTTSKGRDTYGYNICSLYVNGSKVATCNGGGYDMEGTVFGEWLETTFSKELYAIRKRAYYLVHSKNGVSNAPHTKKTLYGMYYNKEQKKVTVDGACGFSSMQRIAEAIGLKVERGYSDKRITTYFVTQEVDA